MKIEEAIFQSKFTSEQQKLTINLMYTGSWMNNIQIRFFKQFDLTPQQYNVLRILKGQKGKPISVNDMSVRMIDRMSNTSRIVERLRVKDLLRRDVCPKDRRQVEVSITKKGLDLLEKIGPQVKKLHTAFNSLTEEEAVVLNKLLDQLRNIETNTELITYSQKSKS
jgi:DNA-binding MarR family transcriptional regulator